MGRKIIFLLASPEKHTREIWAVSLRDCDLDYHPKIHAVVLACTRRGLHQAVAAAGGAALAADAGSVAWSLAGTVCEEMRPRPIQRTLNCFG